LGPNKKRDQKFTAGGEKSFAFWKGGRNVSISKQQQKQKGGKILISGWRKGNKRNYEREPPVRGMGDGKRENIEGEE